MREMKDSGIKTIGKVPAHWKQKRLKFLCVIQTGNEDTQNANPDGEYPFYVRSPIIEKCDRYTFDGEGILVAGDGAGAGRIFHHAFGKYAVHQRVYRLANFKFNPDFIHYYLSALFPCEMDKGSAQSTVPSMRLPMLLNFPLFLPADNEAKRITSFLDKNCMDIDNVIKKLQYQVEVLQEYKQSVITEAITKGLDKDVAMKDSGIDWIGNIPHHWTVKKIKYLGDSRNGLTYKPIDIVDENEGTLVLRSSNIQDGKLVFDDNVYVSSRIPKNLKVKKGDILICSRNGSRELIGKNTLIDDVDATFGAFMMIYRCIAPRFIYYVLNSEVFKYYLGTFFTSTINQLTGSNFNNMKIVFCPDEEERQKITNYLDEKCSKIDVIIADKQKQLDTLIEYKKSLIYEYVTGKKEVPMDA